MHATKGSLMDIKKTGKVNQKWIELAIETAERTLNFMNRTETPVIHVANGYLIVPTPFGSHSVGAGYNPKTKEAIVSVQWLKEKAAQLPPIIQHDTTEELMRFVIGHEVCHYVQDILGYLPPPDSNIGLLITDPASYDNQPHEREANIVGIHMSVGILTPGIGGNAIIEYLKRDPELRGTGFSR